MQTLKLGLLGVGGKLTIDGEYLKFSHPYAWKNFRVQLSQIETVSITPGKFFKPPILKIVGKGTILAESEMPPNWANKAQDWILEQIKK